MRRFVEAHVIDLGLVFVAIVWGASPTAFKFALAQVEPLTFVIMRFLLLSLVSVVALLLHARRHREIRPFRVRRADILLLIVSGLSGYGIYQLLYIEGLYRTTAFASALFGATLPLWSAVILASLRIERIRALQWLGILMSLAGVIWYLTARSAAAAPIDRSLTPGAMLSGNLLLFLAAGLFAVYGIVNKRLTVRYSPPELMCYTLLVGTIALAPFGVASLIHQDWSHVDWTLWVIVPYSVLFPIYITYSIWNWAINKRGVGYVTLFSYATPVIGGIVAYVVLGEALTLWQMVAAGVVLSGMLLARWAITHRKAEPAVSDRAIVEPELAGAAIRESID